MPPRLSLEQLTTPLSPAEVKASIYKVLDKLGVSTTSWLSGSVVKAVVSSASIVMASFTDLTSLIAKSGFLETSEGTWLTLVARYVYGVERIEATYATGEVTLTNSAGGVFSFDPGDLIFRAPSKDKTYVNTEAFNLGANTTIKIKVRAQELGTESNALAGQINELVTTLTGVSCSNALSVLGLDEEPDESLRERCKEKPSAISPNGAREAYSYLSKSAQREDGSSLGVTRVKVSRSSDNGHVTVIVASQNGALDTEDLKRLDELLQTNVVPQGVTMTLSNAVEKTVDVTYYLWVYSSISLDDSSIKATVQDAIQSLLNKSPIGGHVLDENGPGYVFRDEIIETIRRSIPGEIMRVIIDVPSTDVSLAVNEIPVLGTATGRTITRVSR